MTLDPSLVSVLDRFGQLGAGALLVGAIGAFVFRWVYTRGEVNDREATWRERNDELRKDRDAWKAIAESGLRKVDRLTDVVEAFTGKKLRE